MWVAVRETENATSAALVFAGRELMSDSGRSATAWHSPAIRVSNPIQTRRARAATLRINAGRVSRALRALHSAQCAAPEKRRSLVTFPSMRSRKKPQAAARCGLDR